MPMLHNSQAGDSASVLVNSQHAANGSAAAVVLYSSYHTAGASHSTTQHTPTAAVQVVLCIQVVTRVRPCQPGRLPAWPAHARLSYHSVDAASPWRSSQSTPTATTATATIPTATTPTATTAQSTAAGRAAHLLQWACPGARTSAPAPATAASQAGCCALRPP